MTDGQGEVGVRRCRVNVNPVRPVHPTSVLTLQDSTSPEGGEHGVDLARVEVCVDDGRELRPTLHLELLRVPCLKSSHAEVLRGFTLRRVLDGPLEFRPTESLGELPVLIECPRGELDHEHFRVSDSLLQTLLGVEFPLLL